MDIENHRVASSVTTSSGIFLMDQRIPEVDTNSVFSVGLNDNGSASGVLNQVASS